MAYDPGAIDAALAAAVGDQPELVAELRQAFIDGAAEAARAMRASEDGASWHAAALRLRGLAASFGAIRLMALATDAAATGVDPVTLAKIDRAIARL